MKSDDSWTYPIRSAMQSARNHCPLIESSHTAVIFSFWTFRSERKTGRISWMLTPGPAGRAPKSLGPGAKAWHRPRPGAILLLRLHRLLDGFRSLLGNAPNLNGDYFEPRREINELLRHPHLRIPNANVPKRITQTHPSSRRRVTSPKLPHFNPPRLPYPNPLALGKLIFP